MKATIARLLSGLLAGLTTFLVASAGFTEALAAETTAGLVTAFAAATYGVGHKLLRKLGLDDG